MWLAGWHRRNWLSLPSGGTDMTHCHPSPIARCAISPHTSANVKPEARWQKAHLLCSARQVVQVDCQRCRGAVVPVHSQQR